MAIEQVFGKELTETDIANGLSFPAEKLRILPAVAQKRDPVEFQVSCGDSEEKVYAFECVKQQTGPLKPVIVKGWTSEFVRDHCVKVGDFLEFYKEVSDDEPTRYHISIRRCVSSFDDDIGTALHWQRII